MSLCQLCAANKECFVPTLTKKDFKELEDKVEQHTVSKGKVIYTEGKAATRLYMITRGSVKLEHSESFPQPVIVRIAREGEYFGQGAMLPDRTYFLTATALSDVSYCSFPAITFDKMCDPKFCKAMLAEVNKQKDTIVKLALLLLSGTTAAKTAYALQVLSDKNNTINFRKEEIASMVGLTRETVSRELGKLKKKKIIEVEQHRIKITNPLELKQTAKQKK